MSHIKIEHETTNAPAGNALVKHPDNISASSWRRITVVRIRSGQLRPYADKVYEAEICFEGGTRSTIQGYDLPFGTITKDAEHARKTVKDVARVLVRDFKDTPESWADARLTSLELIESGPTYSIWRVRIEEAYTD